MHQERHGQNHLATSVRARPSSIGIVLVLGLSLTLSAHAETATELPALDVIGDDVRGGAPEADRHERAFSSTGLGREVIEQVPDRRLGGTLQRLPGVTMGGAPGERKDVRLRAIDKRYTRTEFGGVQLTDGGEKREFQIWRFPAFLAGEVEVVRNPTAEVEADGLAGRVRVDFREIPKQRTIDASVATGTATDQDFGDQRSVQLGYGERFDDFGMQLGLSRVADPLVKVKDKLKGNERETEDEFKDATFTDAFADFAWYGDGQTLHLRPLLLNLDEEKDKEKRKFKNGSLDKIEKEVEDELKRTRALIVDHDWRMNGGKRLESQFAWSDTDEDKQKLKSVFKADGSFDKTETETEDKQDETFEIKSALTLPFSIGIDHELKFGGAARVRDRFKDKTKRENKGGTIKDKTEDKDNYQLNEQRYLAVFVQDRLHVNDRFSLTPGLRYERVERETESGDGTRGDATLSDVLPSLHATYLLNEAVTLRASASRVINRPKFDELAPFSEEKDGDLVQGNPELEPSRAWAFDLGGEYTTGPLFLGINFYHREVEDLIEQVNTGVQIGGLDQFRFENVGDGHFQGVELEQRVKLGSLGLPGGFELRANQTFADSQVFDEFTGRTRQFNESANVVTNLGLYYDHAPSGTRISINGHYVGEERKTEGNKDERIDPEFSLDQYAETGLTRSMSLFFAGENLTNTERFKDKNGEIETETTGRVFLVGVKGSF
ncbi:TonB-dependent receptor plug domain-containing protein [Marinimicrobium locisalis]|uniref:TonB-dependent receptor plug domain-containing protein n=1 Tax=Marinimicrobium locisalis TaxID=546022 RepID=UPI0032221216